MTPVNNGSRHDPKGAPDFLLISNPFELEKDEHFFLFAELMGRQDKKSIPLFGVGCKCLYPMQMSLPDLHVSLVSSLGSEMCRMPFSTLAEIFSLSTLSGREYDCW